MEAFHCFFKTSRPLLHCISQDLFSMICSLPLCELYRSYIILRVILQITFLFYKYSTMLMWQSQLTLRYFLTMTDPRAGWDCHGSIVGYLWDKNMVSSITLILIGYHKQDL